MNEALLLLSGILSTLFVYVSWKIGEERLYGVIIVFLVLIATTGGKLIEIFGHVTNTGNIYYAALFLATYFLIERYGRARALSALRIIVVILCFFTTLVQISILYEGSPNTSILNDALNTVYGNSIRITLASLVAFILSQTFNIYLYSYLKSKMVHYNAWLRANASNLVAQVVDSTLFFSIAFWGVAPANMWDIIITGMIIKVAYMMCAAPLLYLNHVEHEEGKDYASIKLR